MRWKDHPIMQILFAIGLGIVLVIVVNLGSFGLVIQLASFLVGCESDCSKTQLIGMIVIDVAISIPVGLICILLDSRFKSKNSVNALGGQ